MTGLLIFVAVFIWLFVSLFSARNPALNCLALGVLAGLVTFVIAIFAL